MNPLVTSDLLYGNLPHNADAIAVIQGDKSVTYAELATECDAWAAWLLQLGVRSGDRVGIHLPKSIEEIVATFAIARIGAVFVNINFSLKPFQVQHIIEDSSIALLFCDGIRLTGLLDDRVQDRVRIIVTDGEGREDGRVLSLKHKPNLPFNLGATALPSDLAALLYTSGSTGRAKGVMFSHANVVSGAVAVAEYLRIASRDRLLSLLPLSFDYGLNQVTTAFLAGGSVVLQGVPMASEIARTCAAHAVTGLALVPPAWIDLTRYLLESGERLLSLRYITNSGGRIPRKTLDDMTGVFAGCDIFLMYGLTEAFRATYLEPKLFTAKIGAIGRAIPGTEIFVVHPEKGLCGPGEHGELVQRGPLISMGYWNRPEDTVAKIKPNSFLRHLIGDEKVLHSGDTVYADEDGVLWFVGRADGMIKSSGYRISPEEVEDAILKTGLVKEVVAFGVADHTLGQAIHLAVVWNDNAGPDQLTRWCRRELPSYMMPRTIHAWPQALPRTSSGKYDRSFIAEQADRPDGMVGKAAE